MKKHGVKIVPVFRCNDPMNCDFFVKETKGGCFFGACKSLTFERTCGNSEVKEMITSSVMFEAMRNQS